MPRPRFNPMVGTEVLVTIQFTDETGAPTDPTDVEVWVKPPIDDAYEVLPVNNIGTGIYEAQFEVDAAGQWTVQAVGTGAIGVVDEESFSVRGAAVIPPPPP